MMLYFEVKLWSNSDVRFDVGFSSWPSDINELPTIVLMLVCGQILTSDFYDVFMVIITLDFGLILIVDFWSDSDGPI